MWPVCTGAHGFRAGTRRWLFLHVACVSQLPSSEVPSFHRVHFSLTETCILNASSFTAPPFALKLQSVTAAFLLTLHLSLKPVRSSSVKYLW